MTMDPELLPIEESAQMNDVTTMSPSRLREGR